MVTEGTASVLLNLRLNLDCGYVLVNRAERETNHLSPEIVILTLPLESHVYWHVYCGWNNPALICHQTLDIGI